VAGIPVAAGAAIWSGLVLLLAVFGLRDRTSDTAPRAAGYIFVLATVGLAAVFYYAYTSFFVLKAACPLCLTIDASVIGIFLVSASAAGAISALPAHLGSDLASVRRSPTVATLAALWLVASLGLVLFFPREQAAAATTDEAEAAVPVETLAPEQIDEWAKWLDAQPRAQEVMPQGPVKVLVVKFNDYQCPACRQTWSEYRGIIARYQARYPDVFKFEYRDFPLESECGFGGVHGSACEAAVAVRLAKAKGKDRELGEYFYQHQEEMNRDEVKRALREIAGIDDFDQEYAKVLPAVHEDAVLGQKLGVNGTPTFFINGIKVPSLRPSYFDAAIAHELKKAGVQS
jgi:protein-disulfide isomerase